MTDQATRIGPGPEKPTDPSAQRVLAICPKCGAVTTDRPFCPMDGTLTSQTPLVIGERYRVEEHLGSGGNAFVYGAQHMVLGKPVAIKVLRPELAGTLIGPQRFLREARTASQLCHENLVDIIDFGHDPKLDLMYLVMERLWGNTLAEVIRSSAPLPVSRVIPILAQLCRGLETAHQQGVIHRDLNPRNVVLIDRSGRQDVVKICDFGLSRLAGGQDRITSTGVVVGTPAYMAPEQIRGDATQDHRLDLYSLGVTAYEMVTGRLPHEAATAVALIAAKLENSARPIRDFGIELPAHLEGLIMRCLASNPADRPASAAQVEQSLWDSGATITGGEAIAVGSGSGRPRVPMGDLIGQMAGSYRITRHLATGGVGSVYLAEHPVIGNTVAVKVLLPEILAMPGVVDRFVQEARASSEIGSQHIPRYIDFGYLADGRAFGIMEYLDGETLAARLDRGGRMSVADTATIVGQVARALGQAHAAGIIHRDIKPDNLFLMDGESIVVKVLDFGVAKMLAPGASATKTQFGFFMGTPAYCAPEQALSEEIGPAADIYALGATAFEMLVGRPPFEGEVTKIIGDKTTREAPSVSDFATNLPTSVVRTLARMLARHASLRPASMAEVEKLVSMWTAAPTSYLDNTSLLEDQAFLVREKRRRIGLLAGTSVIFVSLFVVLLLVLRDRPTPKPKPAASPEKSIEPRKTQPLVEPSKEPSAEKQAKSVEEAAETHRAPAEAEPIVRPIEAEATQAGSESRDEDAAAKKKGRSSRSRRKDKAAKETTAAKGDHDIIIADPFQ